MRPTRITVLGSFAFAVVACGIDAVGSMDATGAPPATPESSPPPDRDASTGTIEEDAAIGGVEDAATDAFAGEAGSDDAGPITALLELEHVVAPASVDLTAQGTLDWAYWGANGVSSPVRKTAPNVISTLTIVYVQQGSTPNGFGTTFSWSNATSGSGTSDGYLYVRGGAGSGVSEAFQVPSGPTLRTCVVWVGGNGIRGKLSVRLADGTTTLVKNDASYENQGAGFAVQYTIDFRSVLPAQLEVKWEIDQVYGVNSARFAAVALR